MGLRGRKSLADQEIPEQDDDEYLLPPPHLSAEQQKVWRDVVLSKPPDWFKPDSIPLLEAYCQIVSSYRAISKQLTPAPKSSVEFKRLLVMANQQVTLMLALQTKMRLTQQSRYTPKRAATLDRSATEDKPWND